MSCDLSQAASGYRGSCHAALRQRLFFFLSFDEDYSSSIATPACRGALTLASPEVKFEALGFRLYIPFFCVLINLQQLTRGTLTCRGALTLASPEVKFEIDTETHDPLDVGMYQVKEANHMVEEMMLLANITVAEHILKHFPAQALLRRHPAPPPRQFEPLLKAAVAAGVSVNPETSLVGFLNPKDRSPHASLLLLVCKRLVRSFCFFFSCTVSQIPFLLTAHKT